MQIIPVIDLKDGQVVHAKHGLRAHYQPIDSSLSKSSKAGDIVSGLLKLYPFQILYIADIDAIQGTGSHASLVEQLCHNYPKITWWIDSGRKITLRATNLFHVIGSESIRSMKDFQNMRKQINGQWILSLDYMDSKPLGIPELHESPTYWPDQVICMTLNAVGSSQGVDLRQIQSLQQLSAHTAIHAAGGVRDVTDLQTLKLHGVAGTLIATALHNGKISTTEIKKISQ